jgi:EAL domain-containing protein (putative c-di-GMP-specific phosphodiesterase class I)
VRPDGVVIGPGRFIPLAEELGMIGPIAEAIMREACWKAAAWRREGMDISVAVNVSAIQLNDERFPAQVRRLLDDSDLPGAALELEITESVAMNDPERAIRLVEPLRAQGVRFAIDDFGTGHSSLAALTRLPFDVLKIDQSFVRSLSTDAQAVSIIETILALAASLNFESVAEGVETEAEAEFLRRRGCPIAQGYHFGRPMPPMEFLATLRAQAQNGLATAVG